MEQSTNTQAWLIASEVELIYRTKVKASERPKVTEPKDAYQVFKQAWNMDKIDLAEEFLVMLLNRANMVLGIYHASSGGITGTVADARLIFATALKCNAVSIILAHNHPSGNPKPSRADEDLTLKIKQAGDFLDIKVLDHIIITSEGFFSFADEGMLSRS